MRKVKILLTSHDIRAYLHSMKNITFKADEQLIEKARLKAKIENRSLNEVFNEWLKVYIYPLNQHISYNKIMKDFSYVDSGSKFSRDKMNER